MHLIIINLDRYRKYNKFIRRLSIIILGYLFDLLKFLITNRNKEGKIINMSYVRIHII